MKQKPLHLKFNIQSAEYSTGDFVAFISQRKEHFRVNENGFQELFSCSSENKTGTREIKTFASQTKIFTGENEMISLQWYANVGENEKNKGMIKKNKGMDFSAFQMSFNYASNINY